MLSLFSRMVSGGDVENQRDSLDDDVFPDVSPSSPSSSSSTLDTDEEVIEPPRPPTISIDPTEVGEDALAIQHEVESELEEGEAQQVVELLEHYFSDDHLVRDMFLLKHVTRHREGYVSVKLLSTYKKVKRIAKGWRSVAMALRDSKTLQLNSDSTKVRRRAPLPAHLHHDTRPFRTVLAAGLNPNLASMSVLAEFFAKFGDVTALQLHRPGGRCLPEVRQAEHQHPGLATEVCVLVEYDKVHHARHAVKYLLNTPECGMRHVEMPRIPAQKLPRPNKLNINTDGESAYYSTSDYSEPASPINRVRPSHHLRSSSSAYSSMPSSSAPSPNFRRRARPQQQSSPESSPPSPYRYQRGIPTPSSSPENQLDIRGCLNPPGSSPLPRRILSRPRESPTLRRSSIRGGEGSLSPWLQRRRLVPACKVLPKSGQSSPSASPSLRRRNDKVTIMPDNITRFPRGPDGSKGFTQRRHITHA